MIAPATSEAKLSSYVLTLCHSIPHLRDSDHVVYTIILKKSKDFTIFSPNIKKHFLVNIFREFSEGSFCLFVCLKQDMLPSKQMR